MNIRSLIQELVNVDPELDFVFEQGKMLIISDTHKTPPVIIPHPKVIFDGHFHKLDKLPLSEGKYGTTLDYPI